MSVFVDYPVIETTNYYAFSPFDDVIIDENLKTTAITMIGVYALIFMTGIMGHCCVISYFACGRRCRPSSFSAHLVLSNLTICQLLYLLTCLPASAYKAIIGLTSKEWIFGDIACKMVPFLQLMFLGVTSLCLCAIAVDRFRSSRHVTKSYDVARESWLTGICKIVLIWLVSVVIASPEFLLSEVVVTSVPAAQLVPQPLTVTSQEYSDMRRKNELPASNLKFEELLRNKPDIPEEVLFIQSQSNSSLVVLYDVCAYAVMSWKSKVPPFVGSFMDFYLKIRYWWLLAYYFCLPIFLSLILAVVISRRLTSSYNDVTAVSAYCTTDGGTLTSQREERTPVLEGPTYRSDSLLSNKTQNSETYQQRMERQHAPKTRLSPLYSNEDLTEPDRSPLVVHSNGSIRTITSTNRACGISPQSPLSPLSLTCGSGVSVLSLAMSNTCGGTLGNASLPPHGHRRSIKRRSSRSVKTTLANISRERSFNSLLVTLVLCYTITQLPLHIISILGAETGVLARIENYYSSLIDELSQYFFTLTFIINPVVLFFGYKAYRRFITRKCCHCV